MTQKVVVSDSGVNAGQLENFFRQIKNGSITGSNLQQFMQDPSRFAPETTELSRAIKLLGSNKVVTAVEASQAWNRKAPAEAILSIGEPILQSAAVLNKGDYADFRLVYCQGVSLREQYQVLGTDTKQQPCYCGSSTWWLGEKEDDWAKYSPTPGYRLLDFKLLFRSMNWQCQEDEIANLGTGYKRAHETDVAESCISIFKVHKGERLLSNAWHWGQSLSSGYRVFVGHFDADGFNVYRHRPDDSNGDLGVVVSRN
jgi:hypothetical protein